MKLRKKLSTKQFIISHLLILLLGLVFLSGLYYILNIQYQPPKDPFVMGPITTEPKTFRLEVDEPEDNSLVFQPDIIISGQTAPLANVLIFTDQDDFLVEAKLDGTFLAKWKLDEGVNQLTITAFDPSGDTKSVNRMIYYSEKKI